MSQICCIFGAVWEKEQPSYKILEEKYSEQLLPSTCLLVVSWKAPDQIVIEPEEKNQRDTTHTGSLRNSFSGNLFFYCFGARGTPLIN